MFRLQLLGVLVVLSAPFHFCSLLLALSHPDFWPFCLVECPPLVFLHMIWLYQSPLRPLVLGGDHSISYPVVQAVSEYLGGALDILHLDAHPDIYHAFEGNHYSHASPFARIMEGGYARRLVQVCVAAPAPSWLWRFGVFQRQGVGEGILGFIIMIWHFSLLTVYEGWAEVNKQGRPRARQEVWRWAVWDANIQPWSWASREPGSSISCFVQIFFILLLHVNQ